MPAGELVQALVIGRQSGRLTVTDEGRAFELWLVDGQLHDARADRVRGEQAFFMLLDLTSGAFRFVPGRPETPRWFKGDTMALLMRGLQRRTKPAR